MRALTKQEKTAFEEMLLSIVRGVDFATAHENVVLKHALTSNQSARLIAFYDAHTEENGNAC